MTHPSPCKQLERVLDEIEALVAVADETGNLTVIRRIGELRQERERLENLIALDLMLEDAWEAA